jgi:hypothetical protein
MRKHTIDEVRRKAFGTLEDDIETDLFKMPEFKEDKERS